MPDDKTSEELLLLHPADTVLVVKHSVRQGASLLIDGVPMRSKLSLPMGHKVARRDIAKGEPVLKYGAQIGIAGENIETGDHIHLHNLVSLYTVIEDMDPS